MVFAQRIGTLNKISVGVFHTGGQRKKQLGVNVKIVYHSFLNNGFLFGFGEFDNGVHDGALV